MIPIFIVKYKNPEIEEKCLSHVAQFCDPTEYPVVVVDNSIPNVNLGALWNKMIEDDAPQAWHQEPDPIGLLLNTDCFILDDETLPNLAQAFEASDRVGFVGPMTDNCGSEQKVTHPMWEGRWSKARFAGQCLYNRYISGFCLMFRLKAFRDCGRFPEDGPFYGQESALLYRAFQRNWATVVRIDTFVLHLGGASIKAATRRGEMDQDVERKKGGEWFKDFRKREGAQNESVT